MRSTLITLSRTMGQKANPNSLRLSSLSKSVFNGTSYKGEYPVTLKERLSVLSNLTTFFEKKRCLIKEIVFRVNKEKSLVLLWISFFEIKKRKSSKLRGTKSSVPLFFGAKKFLSTLTTFGYISSKRLVLRNLNKISLNYQKTIFFKETTQVRKNLKMFKNERFFEPSISIFCLLNTMKGNSLLLSKFIASFFKVAHRSKKKSNKFKFFLFKFIQSVNTSRKTPKKLKGLKILIKGRFNRSDRSKKFLFEKGNLPTQSLRADIDYSLTHLSTSFGVFGIHVWIFD